MPAFTFMPISFPFAIVASLFSFFVIFGGEHSGSSIFSFLIFVLLTVSEFKYFASSSSLLGEKYEEEYSVDSVSVLLCRKLLGGVMGPSSSLLLKPKSSREMHMFSPLMRALTVTCKLIAVTLFSVMSRFKHTMFSKFRYVGVEFISMLHRNASQIFSRILPRFSILEKMISRLTKEYLLSCPPFMRRALNFPFSTGVNFSSEQSFHVIRTFVHAGNFVMLSRR